MSVITPRVVNYAAQECFWQQSGEMSVAWMVEGWRYAHRYRFKPIKLRDVLELGRVLRVRGANPRVIDLLVSDSVHRLKDAVQSQRHHRQSGTESARPSCPGLTTHGEGQGDEPREQDCGARELTDVHRLPDPAAGVRRISQGGHWRRHRRETG
jgi:hypothetical protein